MDEFKDLKPSSKHLKDALKVEVKSDKDGKPTLENKHRRCILKARIKSVWGKLIRGKSK